MGISTVKLNGETLMTVNDTTADASEVLSGQYFYTADGTKTQGSVATKTSSNLTASGATVTAPAGYYASDASKAVASGSAATPATTITANPSISVNSSTGLITASVSGSQNITPTVNAGYVASGTAGEVSVSGSNTSQLSTQAAKTVTPTESPQTAVAAGKYTTGAVTVGAISSTYVGSGITQRDDTDLTVSGATVTVPSGYYADTEAKSVASGTAGTPTATKGTVSNHSVSVTPSVTNTTGYITGSTKTGTAVTVSASELVSGSQTITENDTYDVTDLASVIVNVAGSGATEIITGTFTGTTTGAVLATNLQYTGTGQPVAFMIFPSEGAVNPNGAFNTTIQRYATQSFFAVRNVLPITDTNGTILTRYKNSDSTASSYTTSSTGSSADNPFAGGASASNARTVARILKGSSATYLQTYIASTSYGFMANIEYTYVVFFGSTV